MDVGKSFSYVFEDPDWVKKLLIYAAFLLFFWVLVPIPILIGYFAQTMRNVIRGEARPLPEWTNIGEMLVDGLKLLVVYIAYFIPYILLAVLSSLTAERAGALSLLFSCLGFFVYLATMVVLPAAAGEYVTTNDIGAALRFADVLGLVQRNVGDFVVIFLLTIVAGIIGSLGFIACFIGALFTLPYASFVEAHLFGQVNRKARGMGESAVAPALPL